MEQTHYHQYTQALLMIPMHLGYQEQVLLEDYLLMELVRKLLSPALEELFVLVQVSLSELCFHHLNWLTLIQKLKVIPLQQLASHLKGTEMLQILHLIQNAQLCTSFHPQLNQLHETETKYHQKHEHKFHKWYS